MPRMTKKQELHELYQKHDTLGPVYKSTRGDGFTMCSCGIWYIRCNGKWDPLWGEEVEQFIADHPELEDSLHDYWVAGWPTYFRRKYRSGTAKPWYVIKKAARRIRAKLKEAAV